MPNENARHKLLHFPRPPSPCSEAERAEGGQLTRLRQEPKDACRISAGFTLPSKSNRALILFQSSRSQPTSVKRCCCHGSGGLHNLGEQRRMTSISRISNRYRKREQRMNTSSKHDGRCKNSSSQTSHTDAETGQFLPPRDIAPHVDDFTRFRRVFFRHALVGFLLLSPFYLFL